MNARQKKSVEGVYKEEYVLTRQKVICPILFYPLPSDFKMQFLQRKINRRISPFALY